MKLKIVVCGATGNQGGSVARCLALDQSLEVIALSRTISSTESKKLISLGINVVEADLSDIKSLERAFRNAHGVFGVTQPWSSDYRKCDIAKEIKQAQNIINACKHAKVQHLVISSIINPDNNKTGAPHVDSKLLIEQLTKDSDLPYTIIRLPQFMDNIGSKFFPINENKVTGFINAKAKVPYIACKDIGPAVAEAFMRPDTFSSRTINLIGDFISGRELAEMLGDIHNSERFTYRATPKLLLALFAKEFYRMRLMFERMGYPPYPVEIQEALLYGKSGTNLKQFLEEKYQSPHKN